MDTAMQLLIGFGLAATCGFRVFVPLLVMGISSMTGYLPLSSGFEWIATYPALIIFSTATVLEIAAYFFPYVDNLLSAASTPISIAAGTLVTAAVITDLSPSVQWSLAIIAGGGAAASASLFNNAIRHSSTLLTGGIANPFIAFIESVSVFILSGLSILLPFFAAVVIVGIMIFAYHFLARLRR